MQGQICANNHSYAEMLAEEARKGPWRGRLAAATWGKCPICGAKVYLLASAFNPMVSSDERQR